MPGMCRVSMSVDWRFVSGVRKIREKNRRFGGIFVVVSSLVNFVVLFFSPKQLQIFAAF